MIDTALNKEEVQKASQENPDINEEKDRLLAEFAASKARLKEKLARVKAQVKAVTELEDAINRLEACINDHRAIVMSDLPVGPILETEHEKLKEAGVSTSLNLRYLMYSYIHMYLCTPVIIITKKLYCFIIFIGIFSNRVRISSTEF